MKNLFFLVAYNNEQLQLDWLLRNNGRKLEAVTFLGDLNYVNNIFKVEEYSYVKKEREFDGSGNCLWCLKLKGCS